MFNYILGYGSLINLQSLQKTVGRLLDRSEVIPVNLKNYRRVWNLKERLYSEKLDRTICGIFLNIERCDTQTINGIIFQVTDIELGELKKRERNYDMVDVSALVLNKSGEIFKDKRIFTFVAVNPALLQTDARPDCYVMQHYIKLLESGCQALGKQFWDNFKATTQSHAFAELDGAYRFL